MVKRDDYSLRKTVSRLLCMGRFGLGAEVERKLGPDKAGPGLEREVPLPAEVLGVAGVFFEKLCLCWLKCLALVAKFCWDSGISAGRKLVLLKSWEESVATGTRSCAWRDGDYSSNSSGENVDAWKIDEDILSAFCAVKIRFQCSMRSSLLMTGASQVE